MAKKKDLFPDSVVSKLPIPKTVPELNKKQVTRIVRSSKPITQSKGKL